MACLTARTSLTRPSASSTCQPAASGTAELLDCADPSGSPRGSACRVRSAGCRPYEVRRPGCGSACQHAFPVGVAGLAASVCSACHSRCPSAAGVDIGGGNWGELVFSTCTAPTRLAATVAALHAHRSASQHAPPHSVPPVAHRRQAGLRHSCRSLAAVQAAAARGLLRDSSNCAGPRVRAAAEPFAAGTITFDRRTQHCSAAAAAPWGCSARALRRGSAPASALSAPWQPSRRRVGCYKSATRHAHRHRRASLVKCRSRSSAKRWHDAVDEDLLLLSAAESPAR